jgi:hypothetical protein
MLQFTMLRTADLARIGASPLVALSGLSLPVLTTLLMGADSLVSPSLRHRLYVLAGSLAVLAWTYLALPGEWRYLVGNIGCCLVMIAVGGVLLWQSRRAESAGSRLQ